MLTAMAEMTEGAALAAPPGVVGSVLTVVGVVAVLVAVAALQASAMWRPQD